MRTTKTETRQLHKIPQRPWLFKRIGKTHYKSLSAIKTYSKKSFIKSTMAGTDYK